MKLVEILARELEEWPDPDEDYGLIESMSQAADLQVSHYAGVRQKWLEDIGDWEGGVSVGYVPFSRFTLSQLATDHTTAIVTRADWEAERANINAALVITASKPKANAGGWVRHRGGKCPVEAGVVIEYRERCGNISIEQKPQYLDTMWSHDGSPHDIMAYRIHKPAELPGSKSADVHPGLKTISSSFEKEQGVRIALHNPIKWRDRIRELDTKRAEVESTYQRQISEITQERDSLVQELAGEGLALVEVVVGPVEDMSDWRSWRAGDWVVGGGYSKPLKVSHVEGAKYDGKLSVYLDGIGWTDGARFTFYSRPAI